MDDVWQAYATQSYHISPLLLPLFSCFFSFLKLLGLKFVKHPTDKKKDTDQMCVCE